MKTDRLDIRNCDCMDLMREFPDKHFDLAIVDPPYFKGVANFGFYGSAVSSSGVPRLRSQSPHWNDGVPGPEYFEELKRVSSHQIIWGINYYEFSGCSGRLIWDKQNDSSTFSNCEIASCTLLQHVKIWRHEWNGMLRASERGEQRIHPTQKPRALYDWLLKTYAKPGQRILDTHLGSGSHAIAAHYANVHLTACEIDRDYYEAACKRIERETLQMSLFDAPLPERPELASFTSDLTAR